MNRWNRIPVRRHKRERGSALLIVFVFAAIIAIYLYREMPQTLFEAKRQKEELLVERGHEYTRAVQLFYRRNRGQYPASFEQLESTNNVRYLRRRYVDPFTGKADWRLLHAGPGGILIDSKVTPAPTAGVKAGSTLGQTIAQAAGNTGNSPIGSSSLGSGSSFGSSSSDSSGGVVVAPVPQRGPALPGGGAGSTTDPTALPSSAQLGQDPSTPLLPPAITNSATPGQGLAQANVPGNPATGAQGGSANGANVMQTLAPVVSNPTTAPQQGAATSSFGTPTGGQLNSGGLAGIASKATGSTIKSIAKQTNYALWEFYYDPSKDTSMNAAATQIGGAAAANSQTSGSTSTPFQNSNTPNSGSMAAPAPNAGSMAVPPSDPATAPGPPQQQP